MPVTGFRPTQNYNAGIAFGSVVGECEEQVEEWFKRSESQSLAEPELLGFIVALRALAEAEPILVRPLIGKQQIERWKRDFDSWCDEFEKSIKVKRGIDRTEMRAEALAEFDRLSAAISED